MHVLVVDDQEDLRVLLGSIFRSMGMKCTEASGGREALDMLAGVVRPDVVILDVQMPEIDGWETLGEIRSNPLTADLPVILCTVKSRPEDLIHGWEAGCDGYVTKPFDVFALASELEIVTGRSASERSAIRRRALDELDRQFG